jgi:hypothetical protein
MRLFHILVERRILDERGELWKRKEAKHTVGLDCDLLCLGGSSVVGDGSEE